VAGTVHTQAYQSLLRELINLRVDAGLSQAALAKQLQKPASFVGKYELGERRLDIVELMVVLQTLGKPFDKCAAENQQNGLEDAVRYIVLRGLVCGTKREFAATARMSANNVSFVRGPTMRWSIPTVVWKSDGFGGPASTRRCSLEVSNQCPLPEDQKPRECADLS